eukprot:125422_1
MEMLVDEACQYIAILFEDVHSCTDFFIAVLVLLFAIIFAIIFGGLVLLGLCVAKAVIMCYESIQSNDHSESTNNDDIDEYGAESTNNEETHNTTFTIGQKVKAKEINDATIKEINDGSVKVGHDGYPAKYDPCITKSKLKTHITINEAYDIDTTTLFSIHQKVQARDHANDPKFYNATIKEMNNIGVKVGYDGYETSYDRWIKVSQYKTHIKTIPNNQNNTHFIDLETLPKTNRRRNKAEETLKALTFEEHYIQRALDIYEKQYDFIIKGEIYYSIDVLSETIVQLQKKEKAICIESNKLNLENINGWKYKKMSKWSNNDTMNFIKSMNLPKIFEEKILGEIKDNLCTGKDIKMLKSSQDIGDAFNISEKKYLCDKICQNILHFTPIIKKNNNNLQTDVTFKINIFSQNKHLVLNEEV